MFPSFSFPVCCLSCGFNGDALCSGRHNPYWERPGPNAIGSLSPIEPLATMGTEETWRQKPTGLQRGEGSNVWHRHVPGRDVCGHRALLYSVLCGRESAFFSREAGVKHYKRWPLNVKQLAESNTQRWPAFPTPSLIYQSCNHVALQPPQLFSLWMLFFQFRSSQQYLWGNLHLVCLVLLVIKAKQRSEVCTAR